MEILLFHCFRENWWKPLSTIRPGGGWSKTRLVLVHEPGEVYSLSWLLACGKYQLLDCSRFCHVFTLTWETSTTLDMVVLATRIDDGWLILYFISLLYFTILYGLSWFNMIFYNLWICTLWVHSIIYAFVPCESEYLQNTNLIFILSHLLKLESLLHWPKNSIFT